jgi:hypothetical protein
MYTVEYLQRPNPFDTTSVLLMSASQRHEQISVVRNVCNMVLIQLKDATIHCVSQEIERARGRASFQRLCHPVHRFDPKYRPREPLSGKALIYMYGTNSVHAKLRTQICLEN